MGTMRLDLWRRTRRSGIARALEQLGPEQATGASRESRRPGALAPVRVTSRPPATLQRLGTSR